MVTADLNWIVEYPVRRTREEHAMRTKMIEEYIAKNECRYDILGNVEVTAQPTPEDKHNFTPTERVTLDYEGRFSIND